MSETVQITAHFSGRVQGVGFRYTTTRVAGSFEVSGYVKNLSDGRVELVAEGDAAELSRFMAAVKTAMQGYISETDEKRSPAVGEFRRFEVRY